MNISFGSCLLEASHVVFSKGYSVALALFIIWPFSKHLLHFYADISKLSLSSC